MINGTVTVDGQPVDVSSGGSWTGDIVVTSANASGEAGGPSNMQDGSMPPERPADLGPSDEPPGGFGGID